MPSHGPSAQRSTFNSVGGPALYDNPKQKSALVPQHSLAISCRQWTNVDFSTMELSGGARIYCDMFGNVVSSTKSTNPLPV